MGQNSGWKDESRRHSLARKGIKTAKGVVFPPNLLNRDMPQVQSNITLMEEQAKYYAEKYGFDYDHMTKRYFKKIKGKLKILTIYALGSMTEDEIERMMK